MSDPTRLRALAPELDRALDDRGLDPPDGAEDELWQRIEGLVSREDVFDTAPDEVGVGGVTPEEVTREDEVTAERPSGIEARIEARSLPVPALPAASKSFTRASQAKFVIASLAVAAVAVLAIRSAKHPAPVASRGTEGPVMTSAMPPPMDPVPEPAPPTTIGKRGPKPVASVDLLPTTEVYDQAPAQPPLATWSTKPASTATPATPPSPPSPVTPASRTSHTLEEEPPAPPLEPWEDPRLHPSGDVLASASSGVAEARALVRARDGQAALARLLELDTRAPRGVMGEEREGLRIEALILAGRRDQATSAVGAFAEAHPKSALLPYLRQIAASGVVP